LEKTAVHGKTAAFLVGSGGVVFFIGGLGCPAAGFLPCYPNCQNDLGTPASIVGIVIMGTGLLSFKVVYEHEHSQKWAWWKRE
jgi:hypothetical protein